ncbi:MAG: hypothetical protein HY289_09005 [Planctomycetes bacterium]|nr:hypothetical protein [Planctomycetota bacterium]
MIEQERNRRVAEDICDKFTWNGRAFHEGDFVALLDGKVIAVARNPDDAIDALRKMEPNPARGVVIEVARPMVDVIR